MNLIEELKSYKEKKSELSIYKEQIIFVDNILRENQKCENITISELALKSISTENSGSGRTNKINNPTEKIALFFLSGRNFKNDYIEKEKLKQERWDIKFKIYSLEYSIKHLDSLISSLNKREKFIIQKLYVHQNSWKDVQEMYYAVFKEIREEGTLHKIRTIAIKKMEGLNKKTGAGGK